MAYTVNALGQNISMTDRNGTVHQYSFDVLGRQTGDSVVTLGSTGVAGSTIDNSVLRLETAYDTSGRPWRFTSYSSAAGGAANIVNQVEDYYDAFGQLTDEYQSHSGSVRINTGTNDTPDVHYAYSEMSDGANNDRLVSATYPLNAPNQRVITYNYATGVDDRISRVTSTSDDSGTLEADSYLGLSTLVGRTFPNPSQQQPTVPYAMLTYAQVAGSTNVRNDAGDQYTGLDRFGRVIDQFWLTGSTTAGRFQYWYSNDNTRLARENLSPGGAAFSELYFDKSAGVNNLLQVNYFSRGQITNFNSSGVPDTLTDPSITESWNLDPLGNWLMLTTSTPGNPDLEQTRTPNAQNQITGISAWLVTTPTVTNVNPAPQVPVYDNNGNVMSDQGGTKYLYDAWNRLIRVYVSSTTSATYAYDALGRRITETSYVGSTSAIVHLYYNQNWQVIEEWQAYVGTTDYVWDSDPAFARTMREVIPDIDTIRGTGDAPHDWVWNHLASQPGVMQLVPKVQHWAPNPLWSLFHPRINGQNVGGFKLWGLLY